MNETTFTVEITARGNTSAEAIKDAVIRELNAIADKGTAFAIADEIEEVILRDASDPAIPTDHRE